MILTACNTDFVAVTYSYGRQIHLLNFKGTQLEPTILTGLPRTKLSREQIKDYLAQVPAERRENIRKNMVPPPFWPNLNRLFIDDQGHIWLVGFEDPENQEVPYQIINPKGRSLATGTLPQIPVVIRGNHLYYYTQSDTTTIITKQLFHLKSAP